MKTKVSNMTTPNGNTAANQFIIETHNGIYFQSYSSIIARKSNGKITLDPTYWDYSRTTVKYRNIFLRESTKETQAKIDSGEYKFANLN